MLLGRLSLWGGGGLYVHMCIFIIQGGNSEVDDTIAKNQVCLERKDL